MIWRGVRAQGDSFKFDRSSDDNFHGSAPSPPPPTPTSFFTMPKGKRHLVQASPSLAPARMPVPCRGHGLKMYSYSGWSLMRLPSTLKQRRVPLLACLLLAFPAPHPFPHPVVSSVLQATLSQ